MAWPFSNVGPPNFNTGLVAVPTVSAGISTNSATYVLGFWFTNPTASSITVTVTDANGNQVIPAMEIPAGLPILLEPPFLPCNQLNWVASVAGLFGQAWGYM